MIRRRVTVTGRVQGVFYRDTCRRRARGLEVAGWVRNNPDGTVEAVFEGPADAVDAMCEWCEIGPPYAKVRRVEVVDEEPQSEAGFTIR